MTGRIVYTPPKLHECRPGTSKTPTGGGQYILPVDPPYGSLWRCDQCSQHWEWVESNEWVRVKGPANEKPRWIPWVTVALVVFSLAVLGLAEVIW